MIKNIKNNKNLNIKTKIVHIGQEPFDVYIGRPSIYGNPFKEGIDGTRNEIIEKYKMWMLLPEQQELRNKMIELDGKRLGCFCRPTKRCHGDVIIEIIESIKNKKKLDEFLSEL